MKDDPALLKAARRLDKQALAAIFDVHAPAIYKYVLRMCQDPIEADNIVGDVFVKLMEQLAAGQGPVTNLRSYLFKMAYHLVVDQSRHIHRFAPLEAVMETPTRSKNGAVQAHVEERSLFEAFIAVLNTELTEIQRHVIVLRFIEDFSLRETAAIVGKKVNHVKVIQNRGLTKLRKSLGMQF